MKKLTVILLVCTLAVLSACAEQIPDAQRASYTAAPSCTEQVSVSPDTDITQQPLATEPKPYEIMIEQKDDQRTLYVNDVEYFSLGLFNSGLMGTLGEKIGEWEFQIDTISSYTADVYAVEGDVNENFFVTEIGGFQALYMRSSLELPILYSSEIESCVYSWFTDGDIEEYTVHGGGACIEKIAKAVESGNTVEEVAFDTKIHLTATFVGYEGIQWSCYDLYGNIEGDFYYIDWTKWTTPGTSYYGPAWTAADGNIIDAIIAASAVAE